MLPCMVAIMLQSSHAARCAAALNYYAAAAGAADFINRYADVETSKPVRCCC
jgi:hypothetical protein